MESKTEIAVQEEEPVSPTGQYINSSVLSLCILAILELDIPFDDSLIMTLPKNLFLPINQRFSSIMVKNNKGVKRWKKVDVKLQDHVNITVFPDGLSPESNEEYAQDYLSKIAMESLPQNRPLWELHIMKYPTSNAAGTTLAFKLHHALGDGFSLMGALFACLRRSDDPSLPLTFPSSRPGNDNRNIFSTIFNTASDFGWSLIKGCLVEDDQTPIRSGDVGVEFRPITISTVTFSLDQIKQIKAKLGASINDVITGIIFYGTRLYMQSSSHGSSTAESTALVLLNTRAIKSYQSVEEMIKPDSEARWGNQFAFLHVSIPKSIDAETANPLDFIFCFVCFDVK